MVGASLLRVSVRIRLFVELSLIDCSDVASMPGMSSFAEIEGQVITVLNENWRPDGA